MFSQIAIVVMGLFLVVMGFREGEFLSVALGALIGMFATHTLYKLKSGS